MEHSDNIIQEILSYCLHKPGAYEARPFGVLPVCFKVMGKIFAQVNTEESFYKITLKCEPEMAETYRQLYPGVVVRGYHCPPVQQPYWNTVDLEQFEDMDSLKQMIDEAYEAVVERLTRKAKSQLAELSKLTYQEVDGEDKAFATLCDDLDDALDELVGKEVQRGQYLQYNGREHIHDAIVVYQDGTPIGCGSYKRYDDEHAEIKRIYVEPDSRGMGLSAEIVRRLEAKAKIDGYRYCILETGIQMGAARHVYEKIGYKRIDNYGQYDGMPDSVCMERKI